MLLKRFILPLFAGLALVSCQDDDDNSPDQNPTPYNIPTEYIFADDNGNSTVSFGGQTDRLNQLSEMTTFMKTANAEGTSIASQDLLDMFANVGGDGNGHFTFSSSKQLKNKCGAAFANADNIKTQYEAWMNELAAISNATEAGSNGIAGRVTTGESGPYLMDANGFELAQMVEKGLMGAVFYHQITSVYLSDDKIGNAVDNTNPVDPENGKYYTTMEHHWDEAFGYFTSASNFPEEGADRFWSKYSNVVDAQLGTNAAIMSAYLKGRAAIVHGDMVAKDNASTAIKSELEKVAAGAAIHYLNGAHENFANDAKRNHELSEASAFINCLRYNAEATISPQEINEVADIIGENLYDVTLNDLLEARNILSSKFGMDSVKEQL